MPGPCERELLDRARAGDRDAFDQLRDVLQAPVRRFVRRLIGRTDEEEDILQDAFFALYMNLEKMDPVEYLRPFLFRVIRNLCYDELKRRGRYEVFAMGDEWADSSVSLLRLVDNSPLPHEEVQSSFLHAEVQKSIERLPEPQRQVLLLYCDEDFSYEQIAEVMNTDIGTVKSRLHYARKNLIRMLKPDICEALGVHQQTIQLEDRNGRNTR